VGSAVPVLSLGRDRDALGAAEPAPIDHSVRTSIGVILGAVVVIVLLSVVASGGSDDPEAADETPPSTVSPAPRTTAEPRTQAPTILNDSGPLEAASGVAAVWIRTNGTIVVADLGMGVEHVLDERVSPQPVNAVRWTGETFLVNAGSDGLYRLVDDERGSWSSVDTGDGRAELTFGDGEYFSFWGPADDGMRIHVARVASDGSLQTLDVPASFGPPVAVAAGRLYFNTTDGIYRVDDEGVSRHGFGTVVGSSGELLVVRACDDAARCRLLLQDVLAGSEHDLGEIDVDASMDQALPSPDGSAVAVRAAGVDLSSHHIRIIAVDGSPPVTFTLGTRLGDRPSMRWTPDSDALVWWDSEAQTISAARWRAGEVPVDVPTLTMPPSSLRVYPHLWLVPIDALPPGWAPPLD
jgi:hypothetical protein